MIYYFYMSISKTLNSLILKYPKNIFFLQYDRHACHYIVCKRQQGHEYEIKVQIRVIPTPEEKMDMPRGQRLTELKGTMQKSKQ